MLFRSFLDISASLENRDTILNIVKLTAEEVIMKLFMVHVGYYDKSIGAGLAAIALAGAGVGIGIIFGNYLSGAMRNPSAAQKQFPNLLLGFALAEATGLFGLVVALIILFAF